MVVTNPHHPTDTNSVRSATTTTTGTGSSNASTHNHTRKPFSEVVKQWTQEIELKSQAKHFQKAHSVVDFMEDSRPFDELKQELHQLKQQQNKSYQDLLIFACKNGNDAVSLQLLKDTIADMQSELPSRSIKLNKIVDKSCSNCSLLHLCSQTNKPHCMEFLFKEHHIPIDSLDSISATPLLYAVAHNCEDSAAFLLSHGANINAKDVYNKFPLLVALKNKHYSMAELLASFRGIDVHLRGTKGNTALHYMVEEGDMTAVKFLVEQLAASPLRRNNDEEHALYGCLPHPEIAHYLASKLSKKNLSKMLTSVNTLGKNLFHKCGTDGHLDTLLLILKNTDISDLSASQISTLLNEADKNGDTPLIIATKNSRVELVQFLCQCLEVKMNEGDRDSNTALYHAVSSKDKNIISPLKSAGASLKADNKGEEESQSFSITDCMRSLTTLLISMLSFVAILCVISIGAVSLGFFASSISKSATNARHESFNNVRDYIANSIFEHTLVFRTALAQANSQFNVSDRETALISSFNTFNANPQNDLPLTISFYYGNSVGGLIGVQCSPDFKSYILFDSYTNPLVQDTYTFPNIENTTIEEIMRPENKFIVPVTDLYGTLYNTTQVTTGIGWTGSYASSSAQGFLYISLFQTWRDPITNKLLGFCASDIATEALNDFLEIEAAKEDSVIVVAERLTGYILGSSDKSAPLYKQEGLNFIRYDGTNNKKLAPMLLYVRKRFAGVDRNSTNDFVMYETYRHAGKRYAINIASYRDEYGLDWVIMQSISMDFFYGRLYNSVIVMCCVTAALLVFAVFISIAAAFFFMKPLKTLVHQAESIKLLQLEEVEKSLVASRSFFTEIRSVQQSFGSMTARIKQFRQFIPDHILAVIETEVIHKAILIQEKNGSSKNSTHDVQMKTQSGSISDTRGTSTSTNFNARGMVSNALTTGLTSGSVTVMTVTFPDFTELLEIYSSLDISETTRDTMTALKDCIRDSNGQLVSLNACNAVIVWNSFIGQADHRLRACKTARACVDSVAKLHRRWAEKGLPLLNLSIGISSGTVYFGNIGTDATKFFTVIGKPVKRSEAICLMNSEWTTSILCSDDIEEKIRDEFYLRPIHKMKEDSIYVYELGEIKNPDDWAQELHHQHSKDNNHKWSEFKNAYQLFDQGQYDEAMQSFRDYLNKQKESDFVTQVLIQKCQVLLDNQQ